MKDFIIRRKDGTPGYQLTSLLDDVHYGIDMIVRGEDLWPSSLAQLYLAEVLGFTTFMGATFYHHPLIMGPDSEKLSKSGGATSIQHLRKEHKTPADIYTMIAATLGFKTPVKNWEELFALMEINIGKYK
jgi:glutamyl/glutaminyl-tRNA synthetase